MRGAAARCASGERWTDARGHARHKVWSTSGLDERHRLITVTQVGEAHKGRTGTLRSVNGRESGLLSNLWRKHGEEDVDE